MKIMDSVEIASKLGYASASQERNEHNRGKHVNQKGWVTKEDMKKDAAVKTAGILSFILFFKQMIRFWFFLSNRYSVLWALIIFICIVPFMAMVMKSTEMFMTCGVWGAGVSFAPFTILTSLIVLLEVLRSKYGDRIKAKIGRKMANVILFIVMVMITWIAVQSSNGEL